MEHPCLSRRRALSLASLTAVGAGAVTACGPKDEGFGTAAPVRAEDGGVKLEDLPENSTTLVNFGGQAPFVAIARKTGEDIVGFSGYCTHNGCALRETEEELDCPCHGSRFDVHTGEVLVGPATENLPQVPLTIENGIIRRDG